MAEHKTDQEEENMNAELPKKADITPAETPDKVREAKAPRAREGAGPGRFSRGKRRERPLRGDERRSEFAQKLIGIRRVARVMAGGRRFNFSAALVLGDKKGRVGVGIGKAGDTALAIEKAMRAAKRDMITLNLTKTRSIPHNTHAKYCASVVEIRPSAGRGLVAGSSVRTVLELAGVTDVTAKLLSRSKNPINNARAAMKALQEITIA